MHKVVFKLSSYLTLYNMYSTLKSTGYFYSPWMKCYCIYLSKLKQFTVAVTYLFQVWDFPVMTERARLISFLLYGVFSAGKKPEAFSNFRLRAQEVIRGHVHWTEKTLAVRSKPEGTVQTVSLKLRQFLSLLHQDQSWANLALKKKFHNARSLQGNNARSAANQSARTIVAMFFFSSIFI